MTQSTAISKQSTLLKHCNDESTDSMHEWPAKRPVWVQLGKMSISSVLNGEERLNF
jgi:hypothetical protein